MRKWKNIIWGLILILSLSACSAKKSENLKVDSAVNIVAAIFPAYDWTRNVLGENPSGMKLTLLLDSGIDLHSYQPSVDDILTITNADLFIYIGGESDQWVTDILKHSINPKLHVLKMLEAVGDAVKFEESIEGMQTENSEDSEADYDEHVWLSLRNAAVITNEIANVLVELDPTHTEIYRRNAAAYQMKLSDLDSAYTQTINDSSLRTLLFGDRFPFRYMVEDYDLDYYAAFSGCSAETEASFETIRFLAQKCDELSLPAVLTIDGTDHRIAETIVKNTRGKNQQILTLDSMQSFSSKDLEAETTYYSVMENNLDVLKKALGVK